MKANRPSLILYFLALLATIIFDICNLEYLVIYAKAIVVPSIFFYYITSNNYVIGRSEGFIFLFCFIGQVFDLMNEEISELGALFSFMIVYLMLLKMILTNYKKIKIRKTDILPISIVVIFLVYLLISVLSLKFEKINHFRLGYSVYGVLLIFLSSIAFISYITRGTNISLLLSIMSCCFIASNLFYIFDQYFPNSWIVILIKDICQVLSYYLMTQYFLLRKKRVLHKN